MSGRDGKCALQAQAARCLREAMEFEGADAAAVAKATGRSLNFVGRVLTGRSPGSLMFYSEAMEALGYQYVVTFTDLPAGASDGGRT